MNIYENGKIDNTGLGVAQTKTGTVVFTRETFNQFTNPNGLKYKVHKMPHQRYSLAHDNPSSGVAGRAEFERDLLALMSSDDFKL